ncbi:tyrosine-protein phosphatase [Maribacter sp. 2307ULW6-5]|uniref:tyrosine-protein phosphatase n=1 Tax=Maribacter sp. 2307ULW6-5 TaxID=3386275 RepID=UPI0039BD7AD0
MFSFFTKKTFLSDHLAHLVDMHNHILPGIDDGAKNVAASLDLIQGMGSLGITDFICTPHIMANYYPNDAQSIGTAHRQLEAGLKEAGITGVRLRVAAEHMIDAHFEQLLEEDRIMTMDGQYILVEMSYLQPSLNLLDAIASCTEKKHYPILAHPERYVFLHGKMNTYREYKDKGMLMQMNLLSLSDHYGKEVHKAAVALLEAGLIDFVASDIHHTGHLEKLKEIKLTDQLLQKVLPIIERTSYNFQ